MRVDDLDRKIIGKLIGENKFLTTCDLAFLIFNPKDKYELQKLSNKIAYRLKKFKEANLVVERSFNKKMRYKINYDNIYYDDCYLKIGKKEEIYLGKTVVINIGDDFFIFTNV